MTGREALLAGLVVVAVGIAFADSSIVVLALPDLYADFDTTIVAVSWVVTAYNVAIALGAALLFPATVERPRFRGPRSQAWGSRHSYTS